MQWCFFIQLFVIFFLFVSASGSNFIVLVLVNVIIHVVVNPMLQCLFVWAISVCMCVRNCVRMLQPVLINQKHFSEGYKPHVLHT